jgi:hypothetical protein
MGSFGSPGVAFAQHSNPGDVTIPITMTRPLITLLPLLFLAGCTTTVQNSSNNVTSIPDPPKFCAVCGAPTVPIGTIHDDPTRPSPNLSVWNRSICANVLFGPNSSICTRCQHAYSPMMQRWMLALKDPNGFLKPLHHDIADFPLPQKERIKSLAVYSQEYDGQHFTESIGFWCAADESYLAIAQTYAAAHSLILNIERERLPHENYLVGMRAD